VLQLYVRVRGWLAGSGDEAGAGLARRVRLARCRGDAGQTTAEYALVLLAAAAVAFVLIAWAQTSGKLPAFFDQVIDDITGGF
jgi:Flp pilus assembly pilin Flp